MKMLAWLKAFGVLFEVGVDWWRDKVFNNKLPRWVVWIIVFIQLPLGFILAAVCAISKAKWAKELETESQEQIEEQLESYTE